MKKFIFQKEDPHFQNTHTHYARHKLNRALVSVYRECAKCECKTPNDLSDEVFGMQYINN